MLQTCQHGFKLEYCQICLQALFWNLLNNGLIDDNSTLLFFKRWCKKNSNLFALYAVKMNFWKSKRNYWPVSVIFNKQTETFKKTLAIFSQHKYKLRGWNLYQVKSRFCEMSARGKIKVATRRGQILRPYWHSSARYSKWSRNGASRKPAQTNCEISCCTLLPSALKARDVHGSTCFRGNRMRHVKWCVILTHVTGHWTRVLGNERVQNTWRSTKPRVSSLGVLKS